MIGHEPDRGTAENYRRFAALEASGRSPLYAELANGVAGDPELLAFLDTLRPEKRQPNLLFAAVRYLAGVQPGYGAFRVTVLDRRDEVAAIMLARRTQTNEPARCATLLPALSLLPEPLALLEVGASAGLCLLPDRYGYRYGRHRIDGCPGAPVFRCQPRGPVPLPGRVPPVVWRAGIDLWSAGIWLTGSPRPPPVPRRRRRWWCSIVPAPDAGPAPALLTRGGRQPLAYVDGHGTWIRWFT
jgi:Uncharacterized protein conserved in bacteria (DUF2332)